MAQPPADRSNVNSQATENNGSIPGYHIKREIGRGGMAKVYHAQHILLRRDVALKIMNPALSADKRFTKRFLNEGRITAQLNHPNIITIFDIGTSGHNYYLAMELLNGGSLRDLIRSGLPPQQAQDIAVILAKALHFAHQHDVIHRDIKPTNVLFRDPDTPILTDFGIAKTLGAVTKITATGYTIGSDGYMSPEQSLGKELDQRSDLYSFGVMFWEMLTGTMPFHADDPYTLVLKHLNDPLPQLPIAVAIYQPIINKLLAKEPIDRYVSAAEFATALETIEPPLAQDFLETRVIAVPKIPHADGAADITATLHNDFRDITEHTRFSTMFFWPPTTLLKGVFALILGLSVAIALIFLLPLFSENAGTQSSSFTIDEDKPLVQLQREQNYIRQAQQLLQQDAWEEALTAIKTGLSELPNAVNLQQLRDRVEEDLNAENAQDRRQRQISKLLKQADRQWQAQQYVEPDGDNAAQTFLELLELDPLNERARDGLLDIGRIRLGMQYLEAAQTLLDAGNITAAREKVAQGLRLAPNFPGLLQLRDQLQP